MHDEGLLVPIILFLTLGTVFAIAIATRHRERTMMIEKGLSVDEIKALYSRTVQRDPLTSLKWGILLILAGCAVLMGIFLHQQYGVNEGVIVGLITLAVGIGLVLFYNIAAKRAHGQHPGAELHT